MTPLAWRTKRKPRVETTAWVIKNEQRRRSSHRNRRRMSARFRAPVRRRRYPEYPLYLRWRGCRTAGITDAAVDAERVAVDVHRGQPRKTRRLRVRRVRRIRLSRRQRQRRRGTRHLDAVGQTRPLERRRERPSDSPSGRNRRSAHPGIHRSRGPALSSRGTVGRGARRHRRVPRLPDVLPRGVRLHGRTEDGRVHESRPDARRGVPLSGRQTRTRLRLRPVPKARHRLPRVRRRLGQSKDRLRGDGQTGRQTPRRVSTRTPSLSRATTAWDRTRSTSSASTSSSATRAT